MRLAEHNQMVNTFPSSTAKIARFPSLVAAQAGAMPAHQRLRLDNYHRSINQYISNKTSLDMTMRI
jgi:hypothetical protein